MIFDKIDNIGNYHLNLQFIIDDLKTDSFVLGKFTTTQENSFGIGLAYDTKHEDELIWEAHRKYLDIHILAHGSELIQISDISSMEPTNDYQDDYQLFSGNSAQSIHLVPGYFLILNTHEVHKTGVRVHGNSPVKKKVFKKPL